ncbi:MAG: zinc-ribbon domain-containing protein, partial [Candidatus Helarchaeota archaeon]|nr:zinc-ribbon domain-containing protein [Candidatus Helarchaeota archaeon]
MSSSKLEMEWKSFGNYILIVAIFGIFILIPYVAFGALVIQFIFICIAINEIKKINRQLNNPDLEKFRSRWLAASIIKLIALIVINVGGSMIPFAIVFSGVRPIIAPFIPGPAWLFLPIIVLFIVGFGLAIIGSAIERDAWEDFKNFLVKNKEMFPDNVFKNAFESADKLRNGALLWILGFLFITIIIGWIYQIIGYFKLANFKKWTPTMKMEPIPAPQPQATPIPAPIKKRTMRMEPIPAPQPQPTPNPAPVKIRTMKYCPSCGSELVGEEKYCAYCGGALYN